MYLHLIHPDKKFIKLITALFETAAPARNIYLALGNLENDNAEQQTIPHVRTAAELSSIIATRDDWQGVICNGIGEALAPVIAGIPSHLKIAWYIWGHEIYTLWPSFYSCLYGAETRHWVAPTWKHFLRPWVWRAQGRMRALCKVLSRYDYCVCQLREEFELLRCAGLTFRMEYIEGVVGMSEHFDDLAVNRLPLGDDIQVGNSASYTNNFPEVFDMLASMKLDSRKIIVPLSYGDPTCRTRVQEYGSVVLGKCFEPLVDFMSLDQYNRKIQQCGTVIMNHYRQQALGNIMAALWRGARVYLNDTAVYRGYSRLGFELGRLDSGLVAANNDAFAPLPESTVARHRSLMHTHFSSSARVQKTRILLDRLAN